MTLCLVISIPSPQTSVSVPPVQWGANSLRVNTAPFPGASPRMPGGALRLAVGGGDTCVNAPGCAARPHLWPLSPLQLTEGRATQQTACSPSPRTWWGWGPAPVATAAGKDPPQGSERAPRLHRDCPRPTSTRWPAGQPPASGVPPLPEWCHLQVTGRPQEPATGHGLLRGPGSPAARWEDLLTDQAPSAS